MNQTTAQTEKRYWLVLYDHGCTEFSDKPYQEFSGTEEEVREWADRFRKMFGTYRLVDATDAPFINANKK